MSLAISCEVLMNTLLLLVFSNAVTATVMAAGVALIAVKLRRPAVLHVLWIVVLLRLFAPPIFDFGLLPSANEGISVGTLALNPFPSADEALTPSASSFSLSYLVFGGWLIGSFLLAGIASIRTRRFRAMLDRALPADPALESRVRRIAEMIGCRRIPQTLVVDERISPMIWSAFKRSVLVLPRALMVRLTDSQFDTVIAHEMAHLKRGDHRVRWMELAAIVLFWWNPTTWWACRSLRQSEEECCDAIVTAALPNRRRDYASSLVESFRQLSTTAWRLDVASPLSQTRSIERRITTMFTQNIHGSLSTLARFGLILAAVFTLGLTPMLTAREGGADLASPFAGDPISLNLENAELRDVLSTFSELAKIEILTEPSVQGSVTIEIVNTPWDEVLDRILRENKLVYSIEGGRIIVRNADSDITKTPKAKPQVVGWLGGAKVFRFMVPGEVTEPKKIGGPPPFYPQEVRKEGLSGVVVLDCTVGPDGKVYDLEVLRTPDQRLSEAALEAVRQWVFEPSTLDGEPVGVMYILTVKFSLK